MSDFFLVGFEVGSEALSSWVDGVWSTTPVTSCTGSRGRGGPGKVVSVTDPAGPLRVCPVFEGFPSGGSSPDGQVSGMAGGWQLRRLGKDFFWGSACHPVDLPLGYHTASRGPGGLGLWLGWHSGPLDPV